MLLPLNDVKIDMEEQQKEQQKMPWDIAKEVNVKVL